MFRFQIFQYKLKSDIFNSANPSASSVTLVTLPYMVVSDSSLQVVFGALFGEDINRQLSLSSVQFVHKICDSASDQVLKTIGPFLKQNLLFSNRALCLSAE